ncbi:MAG: DUF4129 domain-containing protein [Anaerolineales bacterium]
MSADRASAESNERIALFQGLGTLHLRPWRELSAVALISLELSWVSIGYVSFRPAEVQLDLPNVYLSFGLNMAAAYLLARFMFLMKLKPAYRRIVLFSAYLIATLVLLQASYDPSAPFHLLAPVGRIRAEMQLPRVLIPAELILAGLSAYLWYRAVSLAHSWIDPAVALRSFSLAAFMLTLLGTFMGFGEAESLTAGLVIFLLSGLVALGAARASSLGRLRGSRNTHFTPPWILGILLSVLVVEALALLLGRFASGFPATWTAFGVTLLVRVALILGALLVSPLLLVLMLIWPWFQQQVNASPLLQSMGREISELFSFVTHLLVDLSKLIQGLFESMPDMSPWKPWILALASLFPLSLLFYWFGRRWRIPWFGGDDSAEQGAGISRRNAIHLISRRLEDGLQQLAERLGHLRPGRGLLGAIRIRSLYARLMRLCMRLGSPRASTETPLEFLPTLWQLFPAAREEARWMTEAYNRVRYGERPETAGEVERVEWAWDRIKHEAGRLRQAQRQLETHGRGQHSK